MRYLLPILVLLTSCGPNWDDETKTTTTPPSPVDAGGPDAGGPDAGGPDAGGPDAGGPDAGGPPPNPDAGTTPDAGHPGTDAGTPRCPKEDLETLWKCSNGKTYHKKPKHACGITCKTVAVCTEDEPVCSDKTHQDDDDRDGCCDHEED